MRGDTLIVIESPNKCKKIAEYSGFQTVATVGHFMGLPERELAVDLSNNYAPDFRPTNDIHKGLRRAAQGKIVYLGPDPDREGYAIARHVYDLIKDVAKEVWRVEIHEITDQGVKKALSAAVPFDQTNIGLYFAFLGRRVLDRVVGWAVSGLVSAKLNMWGLSAGRVQSCALRLIVDREHEIQEHQTTTFYRLRLEGLYKQSTGLWFEHTTKRFVSRQVAELAKAKALKAESGTVQKIEKTKKKEKPSPPFTTSSLTATADKKFGFSLKSTMDLAQTLFENGYITYIRTDCVHIAESAIIEIRAVLEAHFGANKIPKVPNKYTSKDSQAEAHEAIRPTVFPPLSSLDAFCNQIISNGMNERHVKLFVLIYLRTLASQMIDAEFDCHKIFAVFGGDTFCASGKMLVQDGWKAMYEVSQTFSVKESDEHEDESEDIIQEQAVPSLSVGHCLKICQIEILEGKTSAPSRFTQGSIVEELERLGIGRPATYASILGVLLNRSYITHGVGKQKRYLLPLDLGVSVISAINELCPFLINYALTNELEKKLDQVACRKITWQEVVRGYHAELNYLDPRTIKFQSINQIAQKVSIGKCQLCDGSVIANKTLPYWGCDRYAPENGNCTFKLYKKQFGYTLSEAQGRMLLAGKNTALLELTRKDGSKFSARLELKDGKIRFAGSK